MITFNGYKNIITNDMQFDRNSRLAFVSMQLNDEGRPDLSEMKKIHEMSFENTNDDILTIVYAKFKNMPEQFFFNNKSLYLGDELSYLREECGDTYNYQREENASMKAYTLMASLTKRMMASKYFQRDEGFAKVFQNLVMTFSESMTQNPAVVFEMMKHSVRAGEPLDKTASFFNDFININMKKFFKF